MQVPRAVIDDGKAHACASHIAEDAQAYPPGRAIAGRCGGGRSGGAFCEIGEFSSLEIKPGSGRHAGSPHAAGMIP